LKRLLRELLELLLSMSYMFFKFSAKVYNTTRLKD